MINLLGNQIRIGDEQDVSELNLQILALIDEGLSYEQKMIQNSKADELLFAKKMENLGYLDCYVFISEYHFDLYNQYIVFARNNKEKIKTYIEKYLIE